MKIAQPLKGLIDINLYKNWKKENRYEFQEVSNLVYEIGESKDKYHYFKTFERDLWGYGYEAIKNGDFPKDIINEQLKLINLLLSRKYWVEI